MYFRILYSLMLMGTLCLSPTVTAQYPLGPDWGAGKIKGVRFLSYPAYKGNPFLNDTWVNGKIEFTDGETVENINIRYSSFKDELVYYNNTLATPVVIDKISLKGFSYVGENGHVHVFRKQYYDGYMKGDRFFEVLADGEIDLLVFKNVITSVVEAYKEQNGMLKNLVYSPEFKYFFYSPQKGYIPVRISLPGLLNNFDRQMQKSIRKLLRKNKIKIDGEESFINAWKTIEKEGYKIRF